MRCLADYILSNSDLSFIEVCLTCLNTFNIFNYIKSITNTTMRNIKNKCFIKGFCHERQHCRRSLFRRSIGNGISRPLIPPLFSFGRNLGIAVGRCFGSRLVTMLVDRYLHHYFLHLLLFFHCLLNSYNGYLDEKVS